MGGREGGIEEGGKREVGKEGDEGGVRGYLV